MKKGVWIICCFIAVVLFYGSAFAEKSSKVEENQEVKGLPGIISILLDEVVAPKPPDPEYQLPDTGQTKCYNNTEELIECPGPGEDFYGQDAQFSRISRSYTKLGQGGEELDDEAAHINAGGQWIMTRDNVTGLIWEVKTADNKGDRYTWQNAQNVFIEGLKTQDGGEGFGGFSDWRLPSRMELTSIVHRGEAEPATRDPFNLNSNPIIKWFPNTQAYKYWSITDRAKQDNAAWRVHFFDGFVNYSLKSEEDIYVRAVVGGTGAPVADMVDNGNGTVTDKSTGLMWQKESAPGTYTWQQALAYAEINDFGGYEDWRLPNINELLTLVDDSAFEPAIYDPFKENTQNAPYWSSTTYHNRPVLAWAIDFTEGYNLADEGMKKDQEFHVRLVRTADK